MTAPIKLTRHLVLEAPQAEKDGSGGYHVTWIELGRLWARIEPRKGRELYAAERTRSNVPCRIIVRAAPVGTPSRPRPEQRFREGPRIFDILSVTEADLRGMYLDIEAEEGAQL